MTELVAIPEGWNAWLDHWPWKASYPSWLRPTSAQPHISPATKKVPVKRTAACCDFAEI